MCCCDSASSERVSDLEKQVDALKSAVLCLASAEALKNWATDHPVELAQFLSSLDTWTNVEYNFDTTFEVRSYYNLQPNQEALDLLRRCDATFNVKKP